MEKIKLVDAISISEGFKKAGLEKKAEAKRLMDSKDIYKQRKGIVKDCGADMLIGLSEDLATFRGIDIVALLTEYESRKTYTDCEEYRKQGAIEVLERMIDMLSSN
jgi:hypothetical protein